MTKTNRPLIQALAGLLTLAFLLLAGPAWAQNGGAANAGNGKPAATAAESPQCKTCQGSCASNNARCRASCEASQKNCYIMAEGNLRGRSSCDGLLKKCIARCTQQRNDCANDCPCK